MGSNQVGSANSGSYDQARPKAKAPENKPPTSGGQTDPVKAKPGKDPSSSPAQSKNTKPPGDTAQQILALQNRRLVQRPPIRPLKTNSDERRQKPTEGGNTVEGEDKENSTVEAVDPPNNEEQAPKGQKQSGTVDQNPAPATQTDTQARSNPNPKTANGPDKKPVQPIPSSGVFQDKCRQEALGKLGKTLSYGRGDAYSEKYTTESGERHNLTAQRTNDGFELQDSPVDRFGRPTSEPKRYKLQGVLYGNQSGTIRSGQGYVIDGHTYSPDGRALTYQPGEGLFFQDSGKRYKAESEIGSKDQQTLRRLKQDDPAFIETNPLQAPSYISPLSYDGEKAYLKERAQDLGLSPDLTLHSRIKEADVADTRAWLKARGHQPPENMSWDEARAIKKQVSNGETQRIKQLSPQRRDTYLSQVAQDMNRQHEERLSRYEKDEMERSFQYKSDAERQAGLEKVLNAPQDKANLANLDRLIDQSFPEAGRQEAKQKFGAVTRRPGEGQQRFEKMLADVRQRTEFRRENNVDDKEKRWRNYDVQRENSALFDEAMKDGDKWYKAAMKPRSYEFDNGITRYKVDEPALQGYLDQARPYKDKLEQATKPIQQEAQRINEQIKHLQESVSGDAAKGKTVWERKAVEDEIKTLSNLKDYFFDARSKGYTEALAKVTGHINDAQTEIDGSRFAGTMRKLADTTGEEAKKAGAEFDKRIADRRAHTKSQYGFLDDADAKAIRGDIQAKTEELVKKQADTMAQVQPLLNDFRKRYGEDSVNKALEEIKAGKSISDSRLYAMRHLEPAICDGARIDKSLKELELKKVDTISDSDHAQALHENRETLSENLWRDYAQSSAQIGQTEQVWENHIQQFWPNVARGLVDSTTAPAILASKLAKEAGITNKAWESNLETVIRYKRTLQDFRTQQKQMESMLHQVQDSTDPKQTRELMRRYGDACKRLNQGIEGFNKEAEPYMKAYNLAGKVTKIGAEVGLTLLLTPTGLGPIAGTLAAAGIGAGVSMAANLPDRIQNDVYKSGTQFWAGVGTDGLLGAGGAASGMVLSKLGGSLLSRVMGETAPSIASRMMADTFTGGVFPAAIEGGKALAEGKPLGDVAKASGEAYLWGTLFSAAFSPIHAMGGTKGQGNNELAVGESPALTSRTVRPIPEGGGASPQKSVPDLPQTGKTIPEVKANPVRKLEPVTENPSGKPNQPEPGQSEQPAKENPKSDAKRPGSGESQTRDKEPVASGRPEEPTVQDKALKDLDTKLETGQLGESDLTRIQDLYTDPKLTDMQRQQLDKLIRRHVYQEAEQLKQLPVGSERFDTKLNKLREFANEYGLSPRLSELEKGIYQPLTKEGLAVNKENGHIYRLQNGSAQGAGKDLKVRSFNVGSRNDLSKNMGQLQRILDGDSPDLVALQEVKNFPELFGMMKKMGMADRYNVVSKDGLVMMTRKGIVPEVGSAQSFAIPGGERPYASRVTVDLGNGRKVDVYNVHLKAYERGSADAGMRDQQLRQLGQSVQGGQNPSIVLGDFNGSMNDVSGILGRSGMAGLPFAKAKGGRQTNLPYQSWIDHVFVSNKQFSSDGLRPTVGGNENAGSDHLPIEALLHLHF